jgi:DNA-binding SARP family transcriptional activator
MQRLSISLLGGMHIELDGVVADHGLTPTIQSLFAYLLLYRRRTHPRDVLANLFWGDYSQERARNCLNTAIWRLRRVLEPEGIKGGAYLSASTGEIGFNAKSDFWLDIAAFEDGLDQNLACPVDQATEARVQPLIQTMKLYTGDLLEGCYADWVLRERERLHSYYLDGLYYLMRYFYSSCNFAKALVYGQQVLNCDPLREDVHRQMMRAYMMNGQRSLAVKQYNLCREMLATELEITPMVETQELFKQIIESGSLLDGHSGPPSLEIQPLAQLHLAMESVECAHKNIQQVIEKIRLNTALR